LENLNILLPRDGDGYYPSRGIGRMKYYIFFFLSVGIYKIIKKLKLRRKIL
jgi:hypothetical protein